MLSPYLHTMVSSNGDLIILDTLNSSIVKVNKDKKDAFLEMLSSNNFTEEQTTLLSELGFITNKSNKELFDELYNNFLIDKNYLHLIILPTEKCNFRCVYCYENYEKPIMTEEVQKSIIDYVSSKIGEYKGLSIEWFGGEPLVAENVIDNLSAAFKSICKENKKPYIASMTTNAYLLNLEMFKKMYKKNNVLKYQITIDGLKETHDVQRPLINGGSTFDTIVNNLISIKEGINSRFFNIILRCNITKNIEENFDKYLEFIDKTFGNDDRFEVLWKLAWELGEEEKNCEFCDKHTLTELLTTKLGYNMRFGTNRLQLKKYGNICYASSKNSFVIGSDASVYKCTVAFDDGKNKVGTLKNGKMLLDENKIKIWTQRNEKVDYSECEECKIYPSCMGIYCNLNNINSDGKLVCNGMKEYTDLYLEHIIKYDYFTKNVSDLL